MKPGTEPDFLLLQKIKNGKSDASEQLIKKYYSSIYQYCLLHTHDRNYAEDLTQETFLHFFA
jgi:DNA-directed RNA polymerase specialized sigma24 family protein